MYAPLSKPEFESLRVLVLGQAGGTIGLVRAAYHTSLLHSESARYFELAAEAFKQLRIRAYHTKTLYDQAIAERDAAQAQLARQQAQLAAEQAQAILRQQMTALQNSRTYAYAGATAATANFSARGFGSAPASLATANALQAAIRTAVGQLTTAGIITVGVAAGFLVGIVALAWPSSLGNGERRLSLSVPVGDLAATDGLDLAGAASRGESVTLAQTLYVEPEGDQAKIYVIPNSIPIPVVQATWDEQRNLYSAQLESPPRIFTWTPIAPPGTAATASTELPATTGESSIYTGVTLMPVDVPVLVQPISGDVNLGAQIIVFPGDAIPPIFVMESRPPAVPLEVGTYSDLSKRSRKDGMDVDHIPSAKSIQRFLEKTAKHYTPQQIMALVKNAPSIVIPATIHRSHSETYGGRNTSDKQHLDASDIAAAIDSNLNAMKDALLENGYSEAQIEASRKSLHDQAQQLRLER